MRVYMLPVAVTATLMSAHLARAGQVPPIASRSVSQSAVTTNGTEPRTPPR